MRREIILTIPIETQLSNEHFSVPLQNVIAKFREHLCMPNPVPLLVTLGAVAANMMPGDPVNIILIGPPGSGKTEILNSISKLPCVHVVSTINESALLSGTNRKEMASDTRGGLLAEVGRFGIVVLKDFTSMLSMGREQRGAVLSALREISDGAWTRRIGAEGGRKLGWEGKLGVLAACTDAIDRHQEVDTAMGDRFMRCRMPRIDPQQQGLRSLRHHGREADIRLSLSTAVSELFSKLDFSEPAPRASDADEYRINALATFAALARSPVERDSYHREIQCIPDPEMPARISKSLVLLYGGLLKIGVPTGLALQCIMDVAMDCIPKVRLQLMKLLLGWNFEPTKANLMASTSLPETTVGRALEELRVHGLICSRVPDPSEPRPPERDGNGVVYSFTDEALTLLVEGGIIE